MFVTKKHAFRFGNGVAEKKNRNSCRSRMRLTHPYLKRNSGRNQPDGGRKNERYFYETVTGSRCSLRTSDKKMEP